MITLKQAKNILGTNLSKDYSDEKLQKEIETATYIAELIFDIYYKKKNEGKSVILKTKYD